MRTREAAFQAAFRVYAKSRCCRTAEADPSIRGCHGASRRGLRAYGTGAAAADYDNDGDLDLFVTSFGPDTLFRNTGDGTARDYCSPRSYRPGPDKLYRNEVKTDGSYLCASDARVHVGLGASPAITAVVIQWPDGRRDRVQDVSADRVVTLKRPT